MATPTQITDVAERIEYQLKHLRDYEDSANELHWQEAQVAAQRANAEKNVIEQRRKLETLRAEQARLLAEGIH